MLMKIRLLGDVDRVVRQTHSSIGRIHIPTQHRRQAAEFNLELASIYPWLMIRDRRGIRSLHYRFRSPAVSAPAIGEQCEPSLSSAKALPCPLQHFSSRDLNDGFS